MKKYLPYILILVVLAGTFGGIATTQAQDGATYQLLAPLPCEANKDPGCTEKGLETVDPAIGFSAYLNLMIKIFIGLCAVLAVVMIVVGGMEIMTSELAHTKQSGKERIEHAILGLVIALGAYILLFTINPDLLNSKINVPQTVPTPSTATPPSPIKGTCFWYEEIIKTTKEAQAACEARIPFNPATPAKWAPKTGTCVWRDAVIKEKKETEAECKARTPLNPAVPVRWVK